MGGAVSYAAAQAIDAAFAPVRVVMAHGRETVVDGIDADLAVHRWHVRRCGGARSHLYASRYAGTGRHDRRQVSLHREVAERVLGRPLGDLVVDHINGDTLDNRRSNVRAVPRQINQRNRSGPRAGNDSGYLGVALCKRTGRWQARIGVNGRAVHLGRFDTPKAANEARLKAERELWGIEPRRAEAHQCA